MFSRRYTVICSAIAFCAVAPISGAPKYTKDEVWQRVFGEDKIKEEIEGIPFPFRYFINGGYVSEVDLFFADGTKETRVYFPALLKGIDSFLKDEVLERLEKRVDELNYIPLAALKEEGVIVEVDRPQLILYLEIEEHARRHQEISFGGMNLPENYYTATRPHGLSGFINLFAGEMISHHKGHQREPLSGSVDWALNYNAYVVEGRGSVLEGSGYTHSNARLVFDRTKQMQRFQVGDLTFLPMGFQDYHDLGGIGFSKNFSLQPYRSTTPVARHTFRLERHSTVEFYSNGQLTRQMALPPGTYDFSDFPRTDGATEMDIKIIDDLGREEEVNIEFPFALSLLAEGLSRYTCVLGFPKTIQGKHIRYDHDNPLVSLSYQRGISNAWTATGYMQGNKDQFLIGSMSQKATLYGTFDGDLAISQAKGIPLDFACHLGYRYYFFDASGQVLRLQGGYRGSHFTTLRNQGLQPGSSYDISANYSLMLDKTWSFSCGADYQHYHSSLNNTYRVRANLGKSLKFPGSLSLDGSYQRLASGESDWSFNIFVNLFNLWGPRHSASMQHEARARRTFIHYGYNQSKTVGNVRGDLYYDRAWGSHTVYSGRAEYSGYRGRLAASTNYAEYLDRDRHTHYTTFNASTALVFANGSFGWSRPVFDSFLIVKRGEGLNRHEVLINPSSYKYAQGIVDNFGAGTLNNLYAYQVYNVELLVPELPIGYELPKLSYSFLPSYKSGMVIELDAEQYHVVKGVLLDSRGEVVSYQSGWLFDAETDEPVKGFFCNRKGRFVIDGLALGRYKMRVGYMEGYFTITADDQEKGIISLGSIQLEIPRK